MHWGGLFRNVFIHPSDEELEALGFSLNKRKYLYTSSNDEIKSDFLYQTDEESFNKIQEKLKGGDYTIKEKDKLYVLPGVKIPKFKKRVAP